MPQPESPDKYHPPALEFEDELDEEELFQRAMEGVRPLPPQPRLVPAPARRGPASPPDPTDLMEEASQAVTDADWPFAPGYQEGGDLKWNRRLLRRLRRGRFSVQAELDLHGYSQPEARQALHRFLEDSVQRGLSCVRIIHGQGHHSPNQSPVLKKRLPEWLRFRRNARYVLAFTSAPAKNGGAGALCVLLRKKPASNTEAASSKR